MIAVGSSDSESQNAVNKLQLEELEQITLSQDDDEEPREEV